MSAVLIYDGGAKSICFACCCFSKLLLKHLLLLLLGSPSDTVLSAARFRQLTLLDNSASTPLAALPLDSVYPARRNP